MASLKIVRSSLGHSILDRGSIFLVDSGIYLPCLIKETPWLISKIHFPKKGVSGCLRSLTIQFHLVNDVQVVHV